MAQPVRKEPDPAPAARMPAWLELLRPKQWAKNLVVLAGILFTGTFTEPDRLGKVLLAIAGMALVSSACYVANDLFDLERDRHHPTKRRRPLASGRISPGGALALGIGALVAGLGLIAALGLPSLAIVLLYLLIQVLYNGGLKRVPVADVYCIAMGFVLRAVLGAAAITAAISPWLVLCAGSLALMLGFAKRRHEYLMMDEQRESSRESLVHYSKSGLDALVLVFACASALCYAVYCIDSATARKYPGLILTAPFVAYGISRYLLLVFGQDEGGEPADLLFRDPHLIGSVLLFIAAAIMAVSRVRIPFLE
ncbi:MAG TPA: UbiA prenyltransferase family protein [Fimbriimonadaceae bacterium]|nr:UbiA prenyltransferase family protein [Fimbriimonadaceae bacterium]